MKYLRVLESLAAALVLPSICSLLLLPGISNAQPPLNGYRTTESSSVDQQPAADGYTVAESPADLAADKGQLQGEGPVRMARFGYVSGNVTWRAGDTGDWTQATVNMPLRQGAEILVLKGGRADVQFDDGSELRLGNGALVALKTMYSDTKGEFTQITLKDGLATIHSRHADSVYQVDAPLASVKSVGPTQVRFGVGGGTEVAVQLGSAAIEAPAGKTTVNQGSYVFLESASTQLQPRPTPAADAWDNWNSDRNKLIAGTSETYRHVPANIGLVGEDLDGYGTWHNDPKQGWVWAPKNQSQDWRPYQNGHWVWVDPVGWTWVSNEPWGWAPYHYGAWYQGQWGWCWAPGPYSQYWSPGVVSFSDYGGDIAWAPLCPWEITYPSFCGLGFWGPNWGLSFSIGWCGGYFPFGGGFCGGRRFDNRFCNDFRGHGGFGEHGGFGDRFGGRNGLGSTHSGSGFVPVNARNGTTTASREAFGGRGSYTAARNGSTMFGSGHTVGDPGRGTPTSGPSSAQPSSLSRTSTRGFTSSSPSTAAAGRNTYQGAVPSRVAGSEAANRSVASGLGRGGAGLSGAEAANAARASLGYTGSSGFGRGSAGNSYAGRSAFSGAGRSFGRAGYGGTGRSYGGYNSGGRSFGGYSGATRSYGSGGFSGGRSGGFSGGRSFSGGGRTGGFSGGSRGGGFSGGGHGGGGGRR